MSHRGNAPLISIVLPVRNGLCFLAEAIESLRVQTFHYFELLIVDDGSTDATVSVARKFAHLDDRIRVIEREHGGVAAALNTGIRESCGYYIARMDADDIALPKRLEKQLAYLRAHPQCVVVGTDAEVIDAEGAVLGSLQCPRSHEAIWLALVDGVSTPFVHPTVLMRKDALLTAGGYRIERFPAEDLDLWSRLIEHGESANIPECLLRYRRHAQTVCATLRCHQHEQGLVIRNAVRDRRGLPRFRATRPRRQNSPKADYHNECARHALRSGRRLQSVRHVSAGIAAAPLWLDSYATLLACVLPTRLFLVLVRLRSRLRYAMACY